MKPLGTILQSVDEEHETDNHFENEFHRLLVNASIQNKNLDRRFINGEYRWYKNNNLYKTLKGHWFKVESDGDYAIRKEDYAKYGIE